MHKAIGLKEERFALAPGFSPWSLVPWSLGPCGVTRRQADWEGFDRISPRTCPRDLLRLHQPLNWESIQGESDGEVRALRPSRCPSPTSEHCCTGP